MINRRNIYEALEYLYIYIAILYSGNIFFIAAKSVQKIIIFGIIIILYSFLVYVRRQQSFCLSKNELLFLILCIILFVFSGTINIDVKKTTYIHFCYRIVISMFFAKGIEFECFREKYTNILAFLALVSLFFWGVYQIQPSFANYFHQIYEYPQPGNTRIDVNAFYLYTFNVPINYGNRAISNFRRNNGLFWEPGAFQFYLILALLFLLDNPKFHKDTSLKCVILLITVLTTGSSAGLVGLIALLIIYWKRVRTITQNNIKKHRFFIFIISVIILYELITGNKYFFGAVDKLKNEWGNNSIITRTGIAKISALLYQGLLRSIFGLGGEGKKLLGLTVDNTYITLCIMYGILFTLIFIGRYYIQYRKLFKKPFGAFLILMIGFSSEVLMNMPVVLALLFLKKDIKHITYKNEKHKRTS